MVVIPVLVTILQLCVNCQSVSVIRPCFPVCLLVIVLEIVSRTAAAALCSTVVCMSGSMGYAVHGANSRLPTPGNAVVKHWC